MEKILVQIGDRKIYLDPVTAARANAKQRQLGQWSREKSRELQRSGIMPRGASNVTGSRVPSNYVLHGEEINNVSSWRESKKEHINTAFESFKKTVSPSLARMNAAFINLTA